ncbi:hypothetical protein FRX31_016445 [Thalictrum thalictroides]|uniref:Uncharacterized protein n=1 Tax=Thalictrum thalictroides TaxID=46969 RepID=A0A7J6VTX1_THATH|nr:hypothetical protein FRX31_022193 [Thalictrum thalictroides]KAF5193968.1 hypothetical protein FRX31_016445 [Thalictrum thalictroides]
MQPNYQLNAMGRPVASRNVPISTIYLSTHKKSGFPPVSLNPAQQTRQPPLPWLAHIQITV